MVFFYFQRKFAIEHKTPIFWFTETLTTGINNYRKILYLQGVFPVSYLEKIHFSARIDEDVKCTCMNLVQFLVYPPFVHPKKEFEKSTQNERGTRKKQNPLSRP